MDQLRVVDLARTMGVTARELIFKLRAIGVTVNSEEDTLDLSTVRSIITGETLARRPREVIQRREKVSEETPTASARDRLARRRKRQVVETEHEIREVVSEKETEKETVKAEPEVADEVVTETETATEVVTETADTVETETKIEVASEASPEAETETDDSVEKEAPAKTVDDPAVPADEVETPAEEISTVVEAEPDHGVDSTEAVVVKPEPNVSEEEFSAERPRDETKPKRVQTARAKTPLERTLRQLSPDEIRQRLQAQKEAEQRRKAERAAGKTRPGSSRKVKAAADAKEIRDLLTKFEEQKIKGQGDGPAAAPSRPGQRPGQRRQFDGSPRL